MFLAFEMNFGKELVASSSIMVIHLESLSTGTS